MDSYSSGEELIIKTRKPYTITKQRERWTEDEHNRFLEALKLYGRAWQRIEEHIGTKTAVQIRSHAQKFFTKLEKEAMVKGIPLGQALDIEIPPPRPKRKPSNPYPRKIISSPASQMDSKERKSVHPTCSLSQAELTIDLEKEPLPEISGDENLGSLATSSSFNKNSSPALMASKKTYTFNEFVPALDGVVDMGESNESQVTVEPGANQILHELCSMQSCKEDNLLDEKLKGIKPKQPETFEKGPKDDWQFGKTQGRRATVQILDGSLSMTAPSVAQNLSSSEHHCGGSGYCVNQPNLGVVQNPDNYQSLVHVSPAFSNLILSALLPNPAVHAAASFAASFWPSPNINSSADSPPQTNAAPSVAAIAAATVAAATAWWASNGLLPVCAPVQLGFNYAPASNCTVPPSFNQEREETTEPALDSEKSNVAPQKIEVDDPDKLKGGKQIDRSSCGSNTASSSEVDTDALEKHGKGGEEFAVNVNVNVNPSSDRRSRSSSSTSESWKEVSEEGRQAFQALFSRQVLPQSFSPPYALNNRGNNTNQNCTSDEQLKHENSVPLSSSSNMKEEGQLTLGKLKVRCTGFKPYKRCSVEAKESMLESAGKEEEGGGGGGGGGQGTKRMRI